MPTPPVARLLLLFVALALPVVVLALPVVALALPAAASDSPAASASPAELMTRLHEALVRDDPRLYLEVVITPEPEPRGLENLRELIFNTDCITLNRFDWSVLAQSADVARVRLDLHGFTMLKGEPRTRIDLPRFWYLELRRGSDGWRIGHAYSDDRRLGLAMYRAASLADAECMLYEDRDADPVKAVIEYSEYVTWPHAGDLQRADHARAIAESFGDVWSRVYTIRAQAIIRGEGQQPEANVFAEEALALARAAGTPDDLADALFTAGIARYLTRDYLGARRYLEQSADLVHDTKDPILAMKARHMANYVANLRGELLQALEGAERLIAVARQYGWTEGEEVATFTLGDLHYSLRNYELALEMGRRAARLAEVNAHPDFLFAAYGAMAANQEKLGRRDEAVALYEKAVTWSGDLVAPGGMQLRLAELQMRRGALAEAEEALRRSEPVLQRDDIDGRIEQVRFRRVRSELLLRQGRIGEAIEEARLATTVITPVDDIRASEERINAFFVQGRALRVGGRRDEAIAVLRQGVAAAEEVRAQVPSEMGRVALLEESLDGYTDLVELLVERGEVREAFRAAEQMKGRALRDVLARGHIDFSASMGEEERRREAELEAAIVAINRELAASPTGELRARQGQVRKELEIFRAEMRLRHPAVERRRLDSIERLTLPDASMAVVEYVVGEQQTTVFCLTEGKLEVVQIPVTRGEIEREAESFARVVSARSLRYAGPAQRLYKLLLEPLEPHIGKTELLCIIPDGALWNVPFQALMPAAATHLVDRHAVFYAQSLSLLNHAFTRETGGEPRLLAFGNPTVGSAARSTFRGMTLGALPDAETEVRSLSSFYDPQSRSAYWRDAARESVFKKEAEHFDIIHVAAHAVIDNGAPMYSAIVLASGKSESEDGLLEAREVVDLELNAGLVVLSACDTARGKVGAGEGVVGIAWAFFAAGCPTTVVSQWKAESRATSQLMVEFHRRLVAGETTAAALRGAQRKLRAMKAYQHPFYWAPFVAVGAAGRSNGAGRTRL
ncbi:MAG TPA: CHAT domain-containing tetratricopeptide repeat protein [Thermoanaerobaculia bacterium]